MRLFLSIFLVLILVTSCEKDTQCEDGLVTYTKVDVQYASFFNFSSESTINLGGMNGDVKLTPANSTDGVIYSTGDVNLNGNKLTLKNVTLIVTGNLNGGGTVVTRGNGALCVEGNVQNNPDLSNATVGCDTMSNSELTTFEELGTNCDLGYVKYVDGVMFKAVKFQSI
jgi:hypothetical protein